MGVAVDAANAPGLMLGGSEWLQRIVGNVPMVLLAVDAAGVLRCAEGRARGSLALGDVVGKPLSEALAGAMPLVSGLRRAAQGEQIRSVAQVGERYFDTWFMPWESAPGGALCIAVEITERVAAEQRLRALAEELALARDRAVEASHAKSAFLANMSHELRTPLNAVIGYSEMLREDAESEGRTELVSDLLRIHSAGTNLLALITDVLDLAKIEAGRVDLHVESVELLVVLRDVTEALRPMAERRHNHLALDCDPQIGTLCTDGGRVRQVLSSLVSNAVKFTENGEITVRARRGSDGGVAIEVRDTGIGLAASELERIFHSFYQVDSSATRQHGGLGVGLALSQRFVELLGGALTVESRPGEGSVFRVSLPDLPVHGDVLVEPRVAVPPPLVARRVLVVDDDPVAQDLLKRLLRREGLEVHLASNGPDGLAKARALRPALITLDVAMPGMDGWGVLRELKADPDLAALPVILVSVVDNRPMAIALGAADTLTKPVRRETLLAAVNRFLQDRTGTVLVVEDDDALRDLMARTLQTDGWQVQTAVDGEDALARIREQPPALVLLDLMMPELDGFEVLARLRADPERSQVPVVVVTAMDLDAQDRARLEGRVIDIVRKADFPARELLGEVRRVVAKLAGA